MGRTPRTVAEVMTKELRTVRTDARLEEAARLLERYAVRQLPVVEDRRLRGLLSYRALLHALTTRRPQELEQDVRVGDLMDPDPVTFSPATPLRHAIRVLIHRNLSAALVLKKETLVGIISEHDIVPVAGQLIERAEAHDAGA